MSGTNQRIGMLSACAHRLYLYRPELFEALRGEGFSVTVFGPEPQSQGEEGLGPNGIEYHALPLSRRGVDPFAEEKARRLLVRVGREKRFGLIYSYGIRFAPLANNAARSLGIPCMNVINGAGSLFIADGPIGELKRRLILPYIRFSLKYSSLTVFQNEDDRAEFSALRLVRGSRCMLVNGSGVNPDRFPVFPLPDKPIFGFCSRMNPEKGIGELLEAFRQVRAEYPEARLRLAGESDGIAGTPIQALLDRLIADGGAEYLGEISDVPSFLKSIRCFVFPSYREGTPRATLEAMSCGRPVITTDATGCRETVKDGYNGLLVPVKNVPALRDAMLGFCSGKVNAETLGKNARRLAEERFSVFEVNRALIAAVKKLYREPAAGT